MAHLPDPVRDKRQRQPAYNADHPGRKIGTEDIDRRGAVTQRSNHEHQGPDEQEQPNKHARPRPIAPDSWRIVAAARGDWRKFRFHLRGVLTSGDAGRARSPTLSARAASVV